MIEKVLPSGEKVTAYPIAIPQQFMLLMSKMYGGDFPINNIGQGYYFKGGMDFDVMKESIYEAIDRCETMRLRFTPDETYHLLQYITENSEMEIETWDYSNMPLDEAHAELKRIAQGPVPMVHCELHKIALVKLAEGYNGIFMKLQHLAMDAYSAKVFLTDIMEIYLHKTQGRAYPKPMRPYIPTLMKELSYTQSEQYAIDQKYWLDSLATTTEPIFTDYMLDSRLKKQRLEHPDRRYADIHSGSPEAGLIVYHMDAIESQKIMDMCEERQLSPFGVLSMGLRTALSIFNGNEEDVSFKMIVNRRGTIAEKKSGGIRINCFPTRSIVSPDKTFAQGVEIVSRAQSEVYQHSSISFWETLALRHKSMPEEAKVDSTYDSCGLSYQPLMLVPNKDEETMASAQGVWYNNGASMIPLYITVRHRASDKGLEFIFEYRKTPDPAYDISVLYKKMRAALLLGAENPDIPVGEILQRAALTDEERKGK